jgi:hypothetical protein
VPEIRSAEVLERQREGRHSLAGFTAASGSRVTFRLSITTRCRCRGSSGGG